MQFVLQYNLKSSGHSLCILSNVYGGMLNFNLLGSSKTKFCFIYNIEKNHIPQWVFNYNYENSKKKERNPADRKAFEAIALNLQYT